MGSHTGRRTAAFRLAALIGVLALLAGCTERTYRSFDEFWAADEGDRTATLRRTLKRTAPDVSDAAVKFTDRVLAAEGLRAQLGQQGLPGGFQVLFDAVATCVCRGAPGTAAGGPPAAESTGAVLGLLGLEGTERLLDEIERQGGDVSGHRVRATEARRAREEEERRRWEATWGPFASWSGRPANAAALAVVRDVLAGEKRLPGLRRSHAAEKRANDRRVRPDRTVLEPIYPQLSGAFAFVKILDHDAGEALFSASDGLFVLRLSFGDSFQAYPGQLVRMTVHNRGETMPMSNGTTLPVFLSGPSPTNPRFIEGFEPDRTEENRLAARIAELERNLSPERGPFRQESGRTVLANTEAPVRVFLDGAPRSWSRVVVRDLESGRDMYCVSVKKGDCSGAFEQVELPALLGSATGS